MKTKRNFLTRLYMRRLSYVTGWKLIQQNKEFRNGLFLQYLEEYRQPTTPPQHRQFSTLPQYRQLTSLPLYRQLDSITDHIIDFKKRPLTSGEYNPAGYGQAFAKTLIRKLEGISCPGLGTAILKDFMKDEENHILENRERKHSQTYYQAFTDYREIKRYADNFINDHLKTVIPTTKPVQASNDLLEAKELPNQKPDEQPLNNDLHTKIFKNNAFEVWESLFEDFKINETSRTDVKFIYEEMKKDGLIWDTVKQVKFLDWISETYGMTIERTSNHSRSRERLVIYSTAMERYNR